MQTSFVSPCSSNSLKNRQRTVLKKLRYPNFQNQHFWCKSQHLEKNHVNLLKKRGFLHNVPQYAEKILNKIAKPLNETYIG